MKRNIEVIHSLICRVAILSISLVAVLRVAAATVALNPRVIPRPLTHGDVVRENLPTTIEYSGGLGTVALGTPVYLEADVNIAVPPASITNVSWTITSKPVGSAAVLTASPLGTNVPLYEPSDQLVYQVAGRALLRPDVVGQYTVTVSISTTANGSTNLVQTLTVGTYMGVNTCALCHSGGEVAPNKVPDWQNTLHAVAFAQGIDGDLGSSFGVSCLQCHTVGYDSNPLATNYHSDGFFDLATQLGWTYPTVLTNGNWASVQSNYPSLANLANVQCENCHGPGSQHAYSLGDTNLISVPESFSGACNRCHDDPPYHSYGTEWLASAHAVTTTIPTGTGRDQCVQCHTAIGFITRINNTTSNALYGITNFAPTNNIYAAITCQACHEPHGQTIPTNNPHMIRTLAAVTLGDGTVVTNAGVGALCLECHHSRDGAATNNVIAYALGKPTWSGGSSFGPHDGVQGDMIEAANAITYGRTFPSSAHRSTVTNLCIGCHMQKVAATDPGFLKVGLHTFEMKYSAVTNGVTNIVDQVQACTQCHGQIASFNFPVEDYDGDGVINGVQTEVQNLLNNLSTLLPNSKGVVDGTVKSSLSVTTNWTSSQLKAAYNWQFVSNDGSLGVHNAPYATGILKASIADLTGVSVAGGLPDAWEVQYFGSTTNALGAPNADPTGDGIPNWLKYTLGLNPLIAGLQVPNGVVYVDGTSSVGGSTNTIQIYTAAEITFNTVAGTAYQIQEVNALGSGWQNVGGPIVATNTAAMSYLTPTRGNAQQFFRVVHTP